MSDRPVGDRPSSGPPSAGAGGTPATVGISGAYGYVGSLLRSAFDDAGWRTVALVRRPRTVDLAARRWDLSDDPMTADVVAGIDVLVHAAWDLSLTTREAIWTVDVAGSRRLLDLAQAVPRVIFVSTMSAFAGTRQLYGLAKLAVEQEALARGQCVVRPGLVYGPGAGGVAGALGRLARWPVVPVPAGPARQYPVHADDLADAVVAVADQPAAVTGPVTVAQPVPLGLAALVRALSPRRRPPVTVAVPWQLPYGALRIAEAARLDPPFRSDSLLGLVRSASTPPDPAALAALGVSPQILVQRPRR